MCAALLFGGIRSHRPLKVKAPLKHAHDAERQGAEGLAACRAGKNLHHNY